MMKIFLRLTNGRKTSRIRSEMPENGAVTAIMGIPPPTTFTFLT